MSYKPPGHILLRRRTEALSIEDLAYLERALQRQLNDACEYYSVPPPGVTVVDADQHLPQTEAVAIDFVDDDGVAAATAHHGWSEKANYAWSLVGVKEPGGWDVKASHEALEMTFNLRLDQYVVAPDGSRWPKEVSDMVEGWKYPMSIDRFGKTRTISLSDYVLPSFWLPGGRFPWDYLGMLDGPFSVGAGGYALIEKAGQWTEQGSSRWHGAEAPERATSRVRRLRAR